MLLKSAECWSLALTPDDLLHARELHCEPGGLGRPTGLQAASGLCPLSLGGCYRWHVSSPKLFHTI